MKEEQFLLSSLKAKGGASCPVWNIFIRKKSELSEERGNKNVRAISGLENMSCEENLKEEFSQSSENYNNLQINKSCVENKRLLAQIVTSMISRLNSVINIDVCSHFRCFRACDTFLGGCKFDTGTTADQAFLER